MKIVPIIQARMGSTRLPEKTLTPFGGTTLIGFLIQQIKKEFPNVMVATTTQEIDDKLASYLEEQEIPYYRGSENDVLDRYYQASKESNADIIIRLTGDNPLTDIELMKELMIQFTNTKVDYMTNKFIPKVPRGLGTELFTKEALEKAWKKGKTPQEREHVTPYMLEHLSYAPFKIQLPEEWEDNYTVRLTVDTPEDLETVKNVLEALQQKPITTKNIITTIQQNKTLIEPNKEVTAKPDTKKYYALQQKYTNIVL